MISLSFPQSDSGNAQLPTTEEQIQQAIAERQKKAEEAKTHSKGSSSTLDEESITKPIVDEMNKRFAVLEQPTFLILEENKDGSFSLDKKQSFKDRFQNQLIDMGKKKKSKAEIFLESPYRRTFRKIVMNPKQVGHYEENELWYYNLWSGFSHSPKEGCCTKLKHHILTVICTGKEDLYEFLLSLLANWVQKPEERTIALLLRGPQGCGKNIFVDSIGKIFGRAYGVYDDVERLLGKFNSELATKVLIFADEALWGGRKSDSGKLKAAITGESLWIEPKGKDKIEIPNYRKFIAASNERFALPLDPDDRRWLVLDCSGHKVGDEKYFTDIIAELEDGGYAAFLYLLLNRDISHFNPRRLPPNDNAFDLKLQGSPSFIKYLYAAMTEERLDLLSGSGWSWNESDLAIRTDLLRDFYKEFCSKEKLILQGEKECGWVLKKWFEGFGFKKIRKRYGAERHPTYILPPLSKSRERLAFHFCISDLKTIFLKDEEEEL